jgi:hypothetical protein
MRDDEPRPVWMSPLITHMEHTLAGASPAIAAQSLTHCENRDVCALKCTHLSVEHTIAGASPTSTTTGRFLFQMVVSRVRLGMYGG